LSTIAIKIRLIPVRLYKRGCPATRIKRELKITCDTAWTVTHKTRKGFAFLIAHMVFFTL